MTRELLHVARQTMARLTIRAALFIYLIRSAPKQNCKGIDVVDLTNDEENPEPYFAKVTSALEIIAQHQHWRLDRIRRDLRYILIVKKPGASYWHDLRACVLPLVAFNSTDAEKIALSIVHEATHARIRSYGIPFDIDDVPRIERICVNEEISLVHFFADGSARATKLLANLEVPWWAPEDMRNRKIKAMEMNGAPPWLVRLLMWFDPPP